MLPLNKMIGAGGFEIINDTDLHTGFYNAIVITEDTVFDTLTDIDGSLLTSTNLSGVTTNSAYPPLFEKNNKPFLSIKLTSGSVVVFKDK